MQIKKSEGIYMSPPRCRSFNSIWHIRIRANPTLLWSPLHWQVNKQCDERVPACTNCIKHSAQCDYPNPTAVTRPATASYHSSYGNTPQYSTPNENPLPYSSRLSPVRLPRELPNLPSNDGSLPVRPCGLHENNSRVFYWQYRTVVSDRLTYPTNRRIEVNFAVINVSNKLSQWV